MMHDGRRGIAPFLLVIMVGVLAGMGHAMWVHMEASGWSGDEVVQEGPDASSVASEAVDAPKARLVVAEGTEASWMRVVGEGTGMAWAGLEIRTDPVATGLSYRLNEGPTRPVDGALPWVMEGDVLDLCAVEALGPVEVLLLHEGRVAHRVVLDSLEAC